MVTQLGIRLARKVILIMPAGKLYFQRASKSSPLNR